jgi:hypothetical protein
MTTIINAATSGGLIQTADTSGVLQLQTASTAAVTIDASQNVGIGTASPAYDLQVSKTVAAGSVISNINNPSSTGAARLYLGNNAGASTAYFQVFGSSHAVKPSIVNLGSNESYPLVFDTAGTERMRITSTGVLSVGSSTPAGWTSPFNALTMNTQGSLMATAGSMQMGNNIYYDGSYKFIGTGYANRYYQNGGDHTWTASSASGSAGGAVTENTLLTLNSSACLILKGGTGTASVGIAFPSTQSASSDANTLDDYEEGTWTPSYALSAGSVSGVTSAGNYVKIGKQVTVNFYITFTTATAASINTITGLPFTVANTTAYSIGASRENANTGYMWQLRPSSNDTVMLIRLYNNADQISSGYSFYGSATYFV